MGDYNNYHENTNQGLYNSPVLQQKSNRKIWLLILIPILVIVIGLVIFLFMNLSQNTISESEFSQGTNFELKENKQVRFILNGKEHTINVSSINSNSVNLIIQSNPIQANIKIGEEEKFELDNDSFYDIKIKLNSINGGIPELYIKKIRENICENICIKNWDQTLSDFEPKEKKTGTILVKKASTLNQCAIKLAQNRKWNLLEVTTSNPEVIRNSLIQLYNNKSFTFLLILGDETQIPIYNKELLKSYILSTGFGFNGEIFEKDENDLDSLYYGNIDNDLYIELAVGRLPFTSVNDLGKYYSDLPNKKQIEKINVLSHAALNIPHIGYLKPQLASYKETEYYMLDTIFEFNKYLVSSDLLYSNSHGTPSGFSIGEYYTSQHIPSLNNKQVIISESCSAGTKLGPEFLKKGAIAYIGYYVKAKLGGLALLDQPSNSKTIGELIREVNNFYYMNQLINPGTRSTYYLIGDPSIELEFNLINRINLKITNNQLRVKIPAMQEYTFKTSSEEVTNIYSQYTYQFSATSSTLNILKENPPYETDNEILIKCDPNYETGGSLPCIDVSTDYPNCPYQYASILTKAEKSQKGTYSRFVIRLEKNYDIAKMYELKNGQLIELDNYLFEIIEAENQYYLIIYEPHTIKFNNIYNGEAYKERTFIFDII